MKKPNLSELTLREKIGQTAAVKQNLLDQIEDIHAYFKDNPYGSMWVVGAAQMDFINMADSVNENADVDIEEKLRLFFEDINTCMRIPMAPALDAENGAARTFPAFNHTTYPTGLGAARNPEYAYEVGKCVASEVKLAGCLWDWGPVVDNAAPLCSINLTRTYSNNPELSCKLVKSHVQGIQAAGVAATVKHFPGADKDEYRDAHISSQAITQSYDEWWERQGVIFQAGIDAGTYSIMIGHVAFEAVDDTRINGNLLPATMSKKIITGLLKEKMGFNGVVITDAIGMRGLSSMFKPEEVYVQALNAGNDVILGPAHLDYIDIIEKAVKDGEISEERINDACQRVLDMKEKLGLFDDDREEWGANKREEVLAHTRKVNEMVAPHAISWVCNKNNLVPLDKNKIKKVQLVYTGYSAEVYKKLNFVKDEFEKYGAEVCLTDRIKDMEDIKRIATEYDLIVYFAHIAPHAPLGFGGFYNEDFRQFLYIMREGKEKSIGISTGSQYVYYDWFPTADTFINTYGVDEETLRVLVRGLYGDCEFTGEHPFDLNPHAPRI
ncbi:MAG: hypothetical protein J6C82_04545 [Clostridia bacterium]|nr:hypothetical protein [Clostridia bacterium]